LHDGRMWARRVLASADDAEIPLRVEGLTLLGWTEWNMGEQPAARACAEGAFALARTHGDLKGMARSQHLRGWLVGVRGFMERSSALLDESRRLLEDALRRARALGDMGEVAWILVHWGSIAVIAGDDNEAHALYEESRSLRQDAGDEWGLARTQN